jgi:hypothetical protein
VFHFHCEATMQHLIAFNKLAAHVPGRPNLCTLHRWRQRGVAGVKLPVVYCGGRVFVDPAALEKFFADVTAAKSGSPPTSRTDRQRERAISAAEKELAAEGI